MKNNVFEKIPVMGNLSFDIKEAVSHVKKKYSNVKSGIFYGVGGRCGGMIPSGHIIISTIGKGGIEKLLSDHFWKYGFKSCSYVVIK